MGIKDNYEDIGNFKVRNVIQKWGWRNGNRSFMVQLHPTNRRHSTKLGSGDRETVTVKLVGKYVNIVGNNENTLYDIILLDKDSKVYLTNKIAKLSFSWFCWNSSKDKTAKRTGFVGGEPKKI